MYYGCARCCLSGGDSDSDSSKTDLGTTPLFHETNTHIGENDARAFNGKSSTPEKKTNTSFERTVRGWENDISRHSKRRIYYISSFHIDTRSDWQTSAQVLQNIHANLHCSALIMVNSESDEAALRSFTLGNEAKWVRKFAKVNADILHPGAVDLPNVVPRPSRVAGPQRARTGPPTAADLKRNCAPNLK